MFSYSIERVDVETVNFDRERRCKGAMLINALLQMLAGRLGFS